MQRNHRQIDKARRASHIINALNCLYTLRWPVTIIWASTCTGVRANLWPIPLVESLPGDALLEATGETSEQIAAHLHPFYTRIATFGSDHVLEPVAYGLKFAGSFGGGTLLKTEFSTQLQAMGVNATAYAAKLPGGQTSVIILNKDEAADLEVELDFGRGASGAVETEILHAPALDSREAHITTSTKTDSLAQGKYSVSVPHATGVRVTLT
jgi:hypothetical protein